MRILILIIKLLELVAQGVCVDDAQGEGGLGGELKIREIQCSSQKCNKNPLFFSMEHGSVLVQSKREKERRSPKLFDNIQLRSTKVAISFKNIFISYRKTFHIFTTT